MYAKFLITIGVVVPKYLVDVLQCMDISLAIASDRMILKHLNPMGTPALL